MLSICCLPLLSWYALISVSGKLIINQRRNTGTIQGIHIIAKYHNSILSTGLSDKQGNFSLQIPEHPDEGIDIYAVDSFSVDTVFIGSVPVTGKSAPLTFTYPAITRRTFLNKTICPKCNHADEVYKIVHGDGLPAKMLISKTGDTTYTAIYHGRYNMGSCITGVAGYYCNRDKIMF